MLTEQWRQWLVAQAEMRYGVSLSPTILATIRSTANGLSAFALGSTPYAPVLRNHKYISGTTRILI